ncbi:hypothetical protein [Streptomyces coffeae]|uniref:Uncharacterized protein n=1 Tax=Streptomyces coffeae TaxID=621382 RepID=A0ABS1NNU3_9ACTN|nr:hypothetical protein [Streptomyces coffeae]MBL1101748.1 hypothetical protein [Streptomyces coffeae]
MTSTAVLGPAGSLLGIPLGMALGMAGYQLVVPRSADAVDIVLPSYMTDLRPAPAPAGPGPGRPGPGGSGDRGPGRPHPGAKRGTADDRGGAAPRTGFDRNSAVGPRPSSSVSLFTQAGSASPLKQQFSPV